MQELNSLAIRICRVLCIFFVNYVHVNPGKENWTGNIPDHLTVLGVVLSDGIGRASVPALSVIGGFLAVSAYGRRPQWWQYVKERYNVLIVPMIAWNGIIIAMSLIIILMTGIQTSIIQHLPPVNEITPQLIIDKLTGIQNGSATIALNFLRDIFACSILIPILLQFIRRLGIFGVVIILLTGLTIGFSPLVVRPVILMFFSIGIYMALQCNEPIPTLNTALKVVAALLLSFSLIRFIPPLYSVFGKDLWTEAIRTALAFGFLVLSVGLSRLEIGRTVARLEPMVYLMFLSHTAILMLLWGGWQLFFGRDAEWPFTIFYLAAPVATLVVLLGLYKIISKMPAAVQILFNGKEVS